MAHLFDVFNDDFFKSLLEGSYAMDPQGETRCPGCGMTFRHFKKTGRFGCGQCYSTFDQSVEAMVKRVQGSLAYEGRVPARGNGVFKTKHQIKRLRQELQEAVLKEDFEKAMILRDQIKALEASLVSHGQ